MRRPLSFELPAGRDRILIALLPLLLLPRSGIGLISNLSMIRKLFRFLTIHGGVFIRTLCKTSVKLFRKIVGICFEGRKFLFIFVKKKSRNRAKIFFSVCKFRGNLYMTHMIIRYEKLLPRYLFSGTKILVYFCYQSIRNEKKKKSRSFILS